MRKAILTVITACLIAAPVVLARPQNYNPGHNPPNVAMRVQHRVNFLTTVLSLTSPQQQQATMIFTNAANANAAILANLKTARRNLITDIKSNEPSGNIAQVSNTIGNYVGQLVTNDASAYEHFYQVLTPNQQTKATQLWKETRGRVGFGVHGFGA